MANTKPVKQKMPNKNNNPNGNPMFGNDLRITNKSMALMAAVISWPSVDLYDPEQVSKRILDYFNLCQENEIRPGISALASVLGIDRRRLWEIKSDIPCHGYDDLPIKTRDCIKKTYAALESNWEYAMQSGGINPPCGIFLGKNQFGYQDVVDYNVTAKPITEQMQPDQLQQRLNALPDDD